jgi:hypothetical protein
MSAETAIAYMLTHDTALNTEVPVAKIFPGLIPVNTVLPAIAFNLISGLPVKNQRMANMLKVSRIQVTVQTRSYAKQKQIIQLIRNACDAKQGLFNSVDVDSSLADIEGPDMRDDDAAIFMQTQDFIVKYRE